ncbi:hypothetical protein SAMN05216490_4652 [Mucilaginibacter mallensis]|uniref:Uncharacterized protein n=1 Tax=Mucilaginibacter mallensis TaxID=652787 RepID=A0A1H2C625_MUCMA|nr:hypothetical protein [Mucilaginibacter mallensis]SDT65759.1 hypothetical protein SAMN05216490_4652 [Mucilaginibacter mallensis]
MNIENPAALHFIMQDDLFFLNSDKNLYNNKVVADEVPVAQAVSVPPVAIAPVVEIAASEKPVEFKYHGKNNKNFLVLVHYPALEFIHETHLIALDNILKRKGFELQDVAIFNIAKYDAVNLETLTTYFKPQKMLILGKSALPQGIVPLALNVPQQVAGFAALYSFSFDEMMDNNDYKKAFWEQMKGL